MNERTMAAAAAVFLLAAVGWLLSHVLSGGRTPETAGGGSSMKPYTAAPRSGGNKPAGRKERVVATNGGARAAAGSSGGASSSGGDTPDMEEYRRWRESIIRKKPRKVVIVDKVEPKDSSGKVEPVDLKAGLPYFSLSPYHEVDVARQAYLDEYSAGPARITEEKLKKIAPRIEDALKRYNESPDPDTAMELARLYLEINRYSQALYFSKKALDMDADHKPALLMRLKLFRMFGMGKKLQQTWDKLISLEPANEEYKRKRRQDLEVYGHFDGNGHPVKIKF